MKEIIAVIRMNKINATKAALAAKGFPSLTASRVMGRGRRPVDFEAIKAVTQDAEAPPEALSTLSAGPRLIAKRMLTLVVPDDKVKDVVDILIETNQTQSPGDGKIFVMPIFDAVRVRTSETGEAAIGEMAGI